MRLGLGLIALALGGSVGLRAVDGLTALPLGLLYGVLAGVLGYGAGRVLRGLKSDPLWLWLAVLVLGLGPVLALVPLGGFWASLGAGLAWVCGLAGAGFPLGFEP